MIKQLQISFFKFDSEFSKEEVDDFLQLIFYSRVSRQFRLQLFEPVQGINYIFLLFIITEAKGSIIIKVIILEMKKYKEWMQNHNHSQSTSQYMTDRYQMAKLLGTVLISFSFILEGYVSSHMLVEMKHIAQDLEEISILPNTVTKDKMGELISASEGDIEKTQDYRGRYLSYTSGSNPCQINCDSSTIYSYNLGTNSQYSIFNQTIEPCHFVNDPNKADIDAYCHSEFNYLFDLNLTQFTNENLQVFLLDDDDEFAIVVWDITRIKTNAVLRAVVSMTSSHPMFSGVVSQSYFKVQFTPATCTGISSITASQAVQQIQVYDIYSQQNAIFITNNFSSNRPCDLVRTNLIYDPPSAFQFLSVQNLTQQVWIYAGPTRTYLDGTSYNIQFKGISSYQPTVTALSPIYKITFCICCTYQIAKPADMQIWYTPENYTDLVNLGPWSITPVLCKNSTKTLRNENGIEVPQDIMNYIPQYDQLRGIAFPWSATDLIRRIQYDTAYQQLSLHFSYSCDLTYCGLSMPDDNEKNFTVTFGIWQVFFESFSYACPAGVISKCGSPIFSVGALPTGVSLDNSDPSHPFLQTGLSADIGNSQIGFSLQFPSISASYKHFQLNLTIHCPPFVPPPNLQDVHVTVHVGDPRVKVAVPVIDLIANNFLDVSEMSDSCVKLELAGLDDFNTAHSTQIQIGSIDSSGHVSLSFYTNDPISVGDYTLTASVVYSDFNKAPQSWSITLYLSIVSGSGTLTSSTSTSSSSSSSTQTSTSTSTTITSSTTCTSTTTTCTSTTTTSTTVTTEAPTTSSSTSSTTPSPTLSPTTQDSSSSSSSTDTSSSTSSTTQTTSSTTLTTLAPTTTTVASSSSITPWPTSSSSTTTTTATAAPSTKSSSTTQMPPSATSYGPAVKNYTVMNQCAPIFNTTFKTFLFLNFDEEYEFELPATFDCDDTDSVSIKVFIQTSAQSFMTYVKNQKSGFIQIVPNKYLVNKKFWVRMQLTDSNINPKTTTYYMGVKIVNKTLIQPPIIENNQTGQIQKQGAIQDSQSKVVTLIRVDGIVTSQTLTFDQLLSDASKNLQLWYNEKAYVLKINSLTERGKLRVISNKRILTHNITLVMESMTLTVIPNSKQDPSELSYTFEITSIYEFSMDVVIIFKNPSSISQYSVSKVQVQSFLGKRQNLVASRYRYFHTQRTELRQKLTTSCHRSTTFGHAHICDCKCLPPKADKL